VQWICFVGIFLPGYDRQSSGPPSTGCMYIGENAVAPIAVVVRRAFADHVPAWKGKSSIVSHLNHLGTALKKSHASTLLAAFQAPSTSRRRTSMPRERISTTRGTIRRYRTEDTCVFDSLLASCCCCRCCGRIRFSRLLRWYRSFESSPGFSAHLPFGDSSPAGYVRFAHRPPHDSRRRPRNTRQKPRDVEKAAVCHVVPFFASHEHSLFRLLPRVWQFRAPAWCDRILSWTPRGADGNDGVVGRNDDARPGGGRGGASKVGPCAGMPETKKDVERKQMISNFSPPSVSWSLRTVLAKTVTGRESRRPRAHDASKPRHFCFCRHAATSVAGRLRTLRESSVGAGRGVK